MDSINSSISSKKWFGFDLDDTLHEFRKASAHASSAVFTAIHNQNPNISIHDLQTSYRDILRSTTAAAFSDGRSSTQYRSERFTLLLQAHGLDIFTERVTNLLAIYQQNLKAALTLKPGALSILQRLKSLNKKIIVVTEGPQDAQEWTVNELGLKPYIDILVTTNEIGKSKVEGLFGVVLEKYGIDAGEMVYVGDNQARDVLPAREVGILGILYDEKGGFGLNEAGICCLNSFAKLENLLD